MCPATTLIGMRENTYKSESPAKIGAGDNPAYMGFLLKSTRLLVKYEKMKKSCINISVTYGVSVILCEMILLIST